MKSRLFLIVLISSIILNFNSAFNDETVKIAEGKGSIIITDCITQC